MADIDWSRFDERIEYEPGKNPEDDPGSCIPCGMCGGVGERSCPDCGGTGEEYANGWTGKPCPNCKGHGEARCRSCNGTGEYISPAKQA